MSSKDIMTKDNAYYRQNSHILTALSYSKNIEFIKNINIDEYFKKKREREILKKYVCSYSYNCLLSTCSLLHGNIADSTPSITTICTKKYTDMCLKTDCTYNHIPSLDIIENDDSDEYYQ